MNAGECVRRLFFVIFAPDSQQESSPLSGRKSTQATVRICGASSTLAGSPPSWWSGPDQLKDVEAFNREVHTLVRAYLESRRNEMRKIDPGLATFICVSAIEAVAHNTVLNQAEMLSEKMARTLVDETTRMVVGYLR
ncbi:hypothetical protein J4G43_030075 [Bradyrhizobium barranii subsp. barranii]|uniref:Tetracyclin repressor SlmA-like C-terminal domain-containing protein n=1 Tax=Bradyrhizobium barranii subsp. barranii TaxID=2823807 RepID=A0A9X9XMU4_9BRAD|nr:hypothetical protein J4G43_030075 [Bradyrhizobium barranii subsp. barranii]